MALLYKIVEDTLLSGIDAKGFAMVLNVPPRVLRMYAVGRALAHALRTLLIRFGLPIEAATLVASTSLGLLGVYWRRRYLIPRLVFST